MTAAESAAPPKSGFAAMHAMVLTLGAAAAIARRMTQNL
jgi:hypothetical protein